MSAGKLYQDMYTDVCRELYETRERLLDEVHQEKMRVIKLEGQRLILLSQLDCAANLLKRQYPMQAATFLTNVEQLRNSYEAAPPKVAVLPTCEARRVDKPVSGHTRSADNASLYAQAGTSDSAPF